jgi:hypothetical protein
METRGTAMTQTMIEVGSARFDLHVRQATRARAATVDVDCESMCRRLGICLLAGIGDWRNDAAVPCAGCWSESRD